MDTNLLRSWLGLPPGPWPPDDREILGFGLELVSPAQVEQRALEQMEKLRPHQLVQPDLVTEGMNRLAQALIALTAVGDANVPVAAPPAAKPRKHRPARPAARPRPARKEVLDAEAVFDAEPLVAGAIPPKPGVFHPPESLWREPVVADEVPERVVPPAPGLTSLVPRSADRRQTIAALVRLRKLLRATENLSPYFGDPGEALVTPARVFAFVRAVREFRGELLRSPGGRWPAVNGRIVARVAGHPLGIVVFRGLVPSQRQALAADWARGVEELRDGYARARTAVRAARRRNPVAVELRAGISWVRENPEWVLLFAVGVAFVIAIIRTAAARGGA